MTQITAVNSTDQPAQLSISRGGGDRTQPLSGKVSIPADGLVIVPPVETYTAVVSAEIVENTYTSATLRLPDAAWRLTARIEQLGEVYAFQLVSEPGEVPELMTLINTVDSPAAFTISALAAKPAGQPILSSQLVVQPRDRLEVGTTNTYAFHAIVDGIVTNTVEVDAGRPGQDVTVQIVAQQTDGEVPGFTLVLVEPAGDETV
jgi:hypothetical protein